jgi:hypothetical protein
MLRGDVAMLAGSALEQRTNLAGDRQETSSGPRKPNFLQAACAGVSGRGSFRFGSTSCN